MNKKIRILLFAKSIDGGTGKFILTLQKLSKINANINLSTIVLEKPSYRDTRDKIFIYLHPKQFYPQIYSLTKNNCLIFLRELLWFNKKVKLIKPDLVISVDIHCNLITIINNLLSLKKYKLILTTHIDLQKNIINKSSLTLKLILKMVVSFFFNRADLLICPSKELLINLIRGFGLKRKSAVIYNGTSTVKISDMNFINKNNTILSIGRLVEQKDFLNLINAFNLLKKDIKQTKLWILGDGPMKKTLENEVKSKELTKDIKFLGWKNNKNDYLKQADIFVLSSFREGFSYVLIEAMACAKPVVSTNTPYGPSEILDKGKYGILVPMKNPEAMKIALMTLLINKDKYYQYAKKAYERSFYFSENKMLLSYEKIITNLLNKS